MVNSPRELYELITEVCGRHLARLGVWALLSAGLALALTLVGGAALWVKVHVVPHIPLPGHVPTPSSWLDVLVAVGITGILIGIVLFSAKRWFDSWERRFISLLDSYFRAEIFERIKHIERNAPDHAETVAYLEWLKNDASQTSKRVAALEQHTDISGLRRKVIEALVQKENNA